MINVGQDLACLERHINDFSGLNLDKEGSIDTEESKDEFMIDEILVEDEPQKKNLCKRNRIPTNTKEKNKLCISEKLIYV